MGIEVDLSFVRGSELAWFLRGGRETLGFSVLMTLTWFLCGGIEIDLISK